MMQSNGICGPTTCQVMFIGSGFGRRLPVAQRRFCDVIKKYSGSGWGLVMLQRFFFFEYVDYLVEVCDKLGIAVIRTKPSF